MNPAIVIPTYWSTSDRLGNPGGTYCYDHATPIDKPNPELDACLASLEQVAGLTHVVLLVVAPPVIEERAVHRVHDIASAHNLPDVVIVDSFKAGFLAEMFQAKLPPDMGEPISLRGYGAIRNMGLLACCALGCDLAVFVDDDEIVLDPDFLANAAYGIGAKPRSGVPVMAKSGYFLDRRNSALADRRQVPSYDKHWAKRQEFNQWMTQALAGPRISRSNTVCGGCFAVHAEAFTRVAFDPWITRGEDLDYLFNLRFYGMDVWFDNRWRVRHVPPRIKDTAFRFLQDVYRWTYERRKIEIGNSHIDLHKLSPDLFMPYPGPWIGPELPKRIKKTALRRAIQTKEHVAYFKIWRNGIKDAVDYAEQNCTRYLEFQAYWNNVATDAWKNEAMEHILRAEGMMNEAVAQRMAKRNGVVAQPVVPPVSVAKDDEPAYDSQAESLEYEQDGAFVPDDLPAPVSPAAVTAQIEAVQPTMEEAFAQPYATGQLEVEPSSPEETRSAGLSGSLTAVYEPQAERLAAQYSGELDALPVVDAAAEAYGEAEPAPQRAASLTATTPLVNEAGSSSTLPPVRPKTAPAYADEKLDGSIPSWMLAQANAANAALASSIEEDEPADRPAQPIDPEVAEKLDAEADEIFQTMVMPAIGTPVQADDFVEADASDEASLPVEEAEPQDAVEEQPTEEAADEQPYDADQEVLDEVAAAIDEVAEEVLDEALVEAADTDEPTVDAEPAQEGADEPPAALEEPSPDRTVDPLEAAVELAADLVPGADPQLPDTFATSVMPVTELVEGAVPDPNADDTSTVESLASEVKKSVPTVVAMTEALAEALVGDDAATDKTEE